MISYGTEQWSTGSDEPDNRRDMDWNKIDPDHVTHISTLSEFRTQFPVLKEGIPEIIHASQDQVDCVTNFQKEQSMLVLNRSTEPMDMPIDECPLAHSKVLQGGLTLEQNNR